MSNNFINQISNSNQSDRRQGGMIDTFAEFNLFVIFHQ
jgi:hypothetical protein